MRRHFLDESLHEGRLARAGLAADDDGLVVLDGQAQELGIPPGRLERAQLLIDRVAGLGRIRGVRALEQTVVLEVVEALDQVRGLAHRDRHRAARDRRRNDELDALAAG